MVSAANAEVIKPEIVGSPASDPVMVPSNNLHFTAVVGAIKRDVGNYHSPVEPNINLSLENKSIAGNDDSITLTLV